MSEIMIPQIIYIKTSNIEYLIRYDLCEVVDVIPNPFENEVEDVLPIEKFYRVTIEEINKEWTNKT